MSGMNVKWDEQQEEWDLECPNTEHHRRYGSGWDTEFEACRDIDGNECPPYAGCPCCEDDSGYLAPIMNYVHTMESENISEEQRIHVAQNTSCIIVRREDTWFVAMTSGGMDLSPDLAYAYAYVGERIPMDILSGLKAGECLERLGDEKFRTLQKELCSQAEYDAGRIGDIAAEFTAIRVAN